MTDEQPTPQPTSPPLSDWGRSRDGEPGPGRGDGAAARAERAIEPPAVEPPSIVVVGASPGPGPPVYTRPSRATAALVASAAGLFCCGFPALVGTILALTELRAISRGLTDPEQQGTARAALALGLLASVLWLAMLGLWILAAIASLSAR